MRQYEKSEVTEIFDLRIRKSCLIYKKFYLQLGVIHIDGILRCCNSIVFVFNASLSIHDRHCQPNFQKHGYIHPVARAAQMLGENHFATSWIQAGYIQDNGYFQFQPFLLAYFGEKAFFVFLHYKINRSKGVFWPKIPLNLTSEGLKHLPEVRVQHETCSTICGTHCKPFWTKKN